MRRPIVLTAIATAILAAAALVRYAETPFIDYAEGRKAEAAPGLMEKAVGGDGFAAFLVGRAFETGQIPTDGRTAAAEWFLTSARQGEIRGVARYINMTTTRALPPDQCPPILSALDLAGRTGEPNALMTLGRFHEAGICTDVNPQMAARYYMGATQIDPRYEDNIERVLAGTDPAVAKTLHPLPELFDIKPDVALAQFLAGQSSAPKTAP